jgi:hypothetical protein
VSTQAEQAALAEGFELLCSQARLIAMFPLEEWRDALTRAETIGAVIDPTLYREYLASKKPEVLKSIIEAALVLKRAVIAAQPVALQEMEGGRS